MKVILNQQEKFRRFLFHAFVGVSTWLLLKTLNYCWRWLEEGQTRVLIRVSLGQWDLHIKRSAMHSRHFIEGSFRFASSSSDLSVSIDRAWQRRLNTGCNETCLMFPIKPVAQTNVLKPIEVLTLHYRTSGKSETTSRRVNEILRHRNRRDCATCAWI